MWVAVMAHQVSIRPRRPHRSMKFGGSWGPSGRVRGSLDVLHLLFDAVDGALDLDDGARDVGVGALAGDGVRLAEHLLREEVQRPAHGLIRLIQELVELL